MREKESLKEFKYEPSGSSLGPKMSGLGRRIFVFTKFVLGICFLPFVYSVTVSFINQLNLIDAALQGYFWYGVITLLILYLFVWEPAAIYVKGQKLTEILFSFFKPLVRVAPYLLPVYTIFLLLIYGALSLVLKDITGYFIFLFGFTFTLHLVFSAKTIRSKKEDFLKTNYIFSFSLIYILNMLLLAFFFSVIFEGFSFVKLCSDSFHLTEGILSSVFNQLFLNNKP